jgi:8-oxo-dGTP diphosphatase
MPTLLVSAAVVIRDRKVLLTQRPGGTHLADLWEFPGGKVEHGESPTEALVRELREELGVEARVGDIVDVTFWRYPTRDVLLLFYRTEIVSGDIQHLGVSAHTWVTRDEIDRYAMPPADVPVVAKIKTLL